MIVRVFIAFVVERWSLVNSLLIRLMASCRYLPLMHRAWTGPFYGLRLCLWKAVVHGEPKWFGLGFRSIWSFFWIGFWGPFWIQFAFFRPGLGFRLKLHLLGLIGCTWRTYLLNWVWWTWLLEINIASIKFLILNIN